MNRIEFKVNNCLDGISVIIPFYKNKMWLDKAIESVENQTLRPDEVIIINDGSDENITDVKSTTLSIIVINQENQGAASARNFGISISKYQFIAFLDSDDYWHPQKLEYQVSLMKNTNAMWSFHPFLKFSNEASMEFKKVVGKHLLKNVYPKITNSCHIGTPCVVVNRNVFKDNNFRFNDSLRYGEDACLWFQLAERYVALILDDNLCAVRMHGNNAANLAHIQLNSRSDLWAFISSDERLHKKTRLITRLAYKLCVFGAKMMNIMSKHVKDKNLNRVAVPLFILPWIMFKLEYRIFD